LKNNTLIDFAKINKLLYQNCSKSIRPSFTFSSTHGRFPSGRQPANKKYEKQSRLSRRELNTIIGKEISKIKR